MNGAAHMLKHKERGGGAVHVCSPSTQEAEAGGSKAVLWVGSAVFHRWTLVYLRGSLSLVGV